MERAVFAWLDEFIIGLELCPFAGAVRAATRVISSRAASTELLLAELRSELLALQNKPPNAPATTLLTLHAPAMADFDAFMQLHEQAQAVASELTPTIQVVPFHPEAVFSDAPGTDAADYATRSPFPMLHLLRDQDVTRAETSWQGAHIPSANADRLRGAGVGMLAGMLARFRAMV